MPNLQAAASTNNQRQYSAVKKNSNSNNGCDSFNLSIFEEGLDPSLEFEFFFFDTAREYSCSVTIV